MRKIKTRVLMFVLTMVLLLTGLTTVAYAADPADGTVTAGVYAAYTESSLRTGIAGCSWDPTGYYTINLYDNIDLTESLTINQYASINAQWKQLNLGWKALNINCNAAIQYGGIAYASVVISGTPEHSPNFDNSWFNYAYISLIGSKLNISGAAPNAFNNNCQIHVDATSTLDLGKGLNIDNLAKVALPEGVPAFYGDSEGKAYIPVVAESGAVVTDPISQFETCTVAGKTYYIKRTKSTAITVGQDVTSITFDRATGNMHTVAASADGTYAKVKFEIENLKKDNVDVPASEIANYVLVTETENITTKINAKPFTNTTTLTFDLKISTVDGSALTKTIPVTVTDSGAITSVTSITIANGTSVRMLKGDSIQLNVTVLPADASNKSVTLSSDNNFVTLAQDTLTITGADFGTSVVTVTADDGSLVTATITVIVDKGDKADGTYFFDDYGNKFFAVGSEETFRQAAAGSDFYIALVGDVTLTADCEIVGGKLYQFNHAGEKWATLDLGAFTLTYSGNVFFFYGTIANGTVNILNNSSNDSEFHSIYFWYTFVKLTNSKAKITESSGLGAASQFFVDETSTLTYDNGTDLKNILTMDIPTGVPAYYADKDGKIICPIFESTGAVVTFTAAAPFKKIATDTYSYYLLTDVELVKIQTITIAQGASANLTVNEYLLLTINFMPTNATYREVKVTSSDTKVVTVGLNNKLRAVGAGKATITVEALDGSAVTAQIVINVAPEKPVAPSTSCAMGSANILLCLGVCFLVVIKLKGKSIF